MHNRFISIIKRVIQENIYFAILILVLFIYLIPRALPETHMDFMSAQTIMGVRWWVNDGFVKNHFLLKLAGYGKIANYMDDPALQNHAKGTVAGIIGHRIYYTHYPVLYAVPVAIMLKIGINNPFAFRILFITFAILGLIFFYKFVKIITNKIVAFVAVFYFSISPIFITNADIIYRYSLENFWMFLILFLSIVIFQRLNTRTNSVRDGKIKWLLISVWITYFLLALTSFDETIFIFVWLMGLSIVYLYNSKNLRKIWLFIFLMIFWALAPILAFVTQIIQNATYLGWHTVWLDFYGAFIQSGNRSGLGPMLITEALIRPFFSMTGFFNIYSLINQSSIGKFKRIIFPSSIPLIFILTPLMILVGVFILKLKKFINIKLPPLYIFILLVIAPMLQILPLTGLGFREDIGRLMAPFIGIIIGIFFLSLFQWYKAKKTTSKLKVLDSIIFFLFFATLSMLFIIQIILNIFPKAYLKYDSLSKNDINFAKSIKNIAVGEKAVFMINISDSQIPKEELEKRNASIDPTPYILNYVVWEYYFDIPLLNFTETSYLIRDLLFLKKRSEFPFTAIITSDDKNLINELYDKLSAKKLPLSAIDKLENRYYFIISPIFKINSLPSI